jgi:alkaline phosphatase
MKCLILSIGFTLVSFLTSAQPLIHAHNDYQKPEPLTNALKNKVFSIEADIYLYNSKLVVAHDKNELPTARTLDSLYLQPIIELFRKHKGNISKDVNYSPALMIDIKENSEAVMTELVKLLSPHRSVFDRSVNSKAVQIVISGDRGPLAKWKSFPAFILFDGRPYEVYDSATLHRVAFISDSYLNYINAQDSTSRLEQLVSKIRGIGKLLRLWAIPDNPTSWKRLQQLGIDIINTDKVEECRNYFYQSRSF